MASISRLLESLESTYARGESHRLEEDKGGTDIFQIMFPSSELSAFAKQVPKEFQERFLDLMVKLGKALQPNERTAAAARMFAHMIKRPPGKNVGADIQDISELFGKITRS